MYVAELTNQDSYVNLLYCFLVTSILILKVNNYVTTIWLSYENISGKKRIRGQFEIFLIYACCTFLSASMLMVSGSNFSIVASS